MALVMVTSGEKGDVFFVKPLTKFQYFSSHCLSPKHTLIIPNVKNIKILSDLKLLREIEPL